MRASDVCFLVMVAPLMIPVSLQQPCALLLVIREEIEKYRLFFAIGFRWNKNIMAPIQISHINLTYFPVKSRQQYPFLLLTKTDIHGHKMPIIRINFMRHGHKILSINSVIKHNFLIMHFRLNLHLFLSQYKIMYAMFMRKCFRLYFKPWSDSAINCNNHLDLVLVAHRADIYW